jgi:hypothetical protein
VAVRRTRESDRAGPNIKLTPAVDLAVAQLIPRGWQRGLVCSEYDTELSRCAAESAGGTETVPEFTGAGIEASVCVIGPDARTNHAIHGAAFFVASSAATISAYLLIFRY